MYADRLFEEFSLQTPNDVVVVKLLAIPGPDKVPDKLPRVINFRKIFESEYV